MEDESITILGKLYQKIYFHYLILKEKKLLLNLSCIGNKYMYKPKAMIWQCWGGSHLFCIFQSHWTLQKAFLHIMMD